MPVSSEIVQRKIRRGRAAEAEHSAVDRWVSTSDTELARANAAAYGARTALLKAAARRPRLDRHDGDGQGSQPPLRNAQRAGQRHRPVPGGRAGAREPAVVRLPGPQAVPPLPGPGVGGAAAVRHAGGGRDLDQRVRCAVCPFRGRAAGESDRARGHRLRGSPGAREGADGQRSLRGPGGHPGPGPAGSASGSGGLGRRAEGRPRVALAPVPSSVGG